MLPIRSHLRLALALAAFLFMAGSLARIVFGLWFAPQAVSAADWAGALWLGARFDARVALVSVLLVWLLGALPWLGSRLRPPHWRGLWWACWMIAVGVWGAAVTFDAGHYAYLAQRLSAVVFSLARDTGEAAGMVWQSYPVVWIVLGFMLWMLLCHAVFALLWVKLAHTEPMRLRSARITEAVVVALAVFVVHGKLSQYPLRWSDAVELPNTFAQSLALNPLHSLYDTWTFRAQRLDDAQIRPDADAIRAFVGLPPLKPGEPISFLRSVPPRPGAEPLNVVLVLLESFAGHKTGALGNPLGATPSFDALARDGLLFTRMMSAHSHTARGVFATVTGVPDVSLQSTASRNPAATNQHTIVNEFKGYQKFYFIGGSTSWANVRGVLTANIDGIDIYEQTRLKSPVVDVWGVSDKNVFLEANGLFRTQKTPFFAIIQTSGNHRPYSIPDEDLTGGFAPLAPSEAELKAQGFISRAEYRAFAYLDWCIGQFMLRAQKEAYFKNTVFAFIGDHGIIGPTGPHLPRAWQDLAITQGHTPLLIYAPGHVPPRRVDSWAQQVDVLPTLASIVGIGYRNTTLGRDLLDARFDATRVAFNFQFTGPGEQGVLVGQHMLIERKPLAAYDIQSSTPTVNLLAQQPVPPELQQLVQAWGRFPDAYGNAALYMQTHNPRFRD
ncbi:MAG: LTA synthase family protein [Cytophagales bacterium]|nr:LTA synthase family protein [Rhizobacter sp.]